MARKIQDQVDAPRNQVEQVDKQAVTRKATPEEIRRAIKTGRPVYKRVTRQVRKIDITEATK